VMEGEMEDSVIILGVFGSTRWVRAFTHWHHWTHYWNWSREPSCHKSTFRLTSAACIVDTSMYVVAIRMSQWWRRVCADIKPIGGGGCTTNIDIVLVPCYLIESATINLKITWAWKVAWQHSW
jgi:hypothetical protein